MKFPTLFKPIRLGSLIVSNRIMASPMGHPDSHKHPSTIYYGGVNIHDKALGGSGAILLDTFPALEDGHFAKADRDVYKENISIARAKGAKVGGLVCLQPLGSKMEGPSEYNNPGQPYIAEISKENMKAYIRNLINTINACREMYFDYVVLHFAHDQIPALFLAPLFNKRTDEYGGSLENRMRYLVEIVKEVRKEIPRSFPIGIRCSGELYLEGSYKVEDLIEFLKVVKDDIDFVNLSGGMDIFYEVNARQCPINFMPHALNRDNAHKIKQAIPELPLVLVGSITNPKEAEEILVSHDADMIMLGKALNADPFWPIKAREDRDDDIIPCLRCGYCYHANTAHFDTGCSVNPRFMRELRVPLNIENAEKCKNVLIVGGGPAGMKAAITACERGHNVTIVEKSDKLGGQIKCAEFEHYKVDLNAYKEYLIHQVYKHNINVILNTKADENFIRNFNPDALIIAIGAKPVTPNINGIDKQIVSEATATYPKLNTLGQKIVIIGGGTIGCELGLDLAEDKKDVTIIELSNQLSSKGNKMYRITLMQLLDKNKEHLHIMLNTNCLEVKDDGVVVKDHSGKQSFIEADNVILAIGMTPNKDEVYSLYGIVPETYSIGDCERSGKIMQATEDGFFIAYNL